MTPSDLKYLHERKCPESSFFSRDSMRFFGDTMRNYGVYSATLAYADGSDPIDGFVLYRKTPVNNGLQSDHCFTCEGEHTQRKPID